VCSGSLSGAFFILLSQELGEWQWPLVKFDS
jgi:hypothetical protein